MKFVKLILELEVGIWAVLCHDEFDQLSVLDGCSLYVFEIVLVDGLPAVCIGEMVSEVVVREQFTVPQVIDGVELNCDSNFGNATYKEWDNTDNTITVFQ